MKLILVIANGEKKMSSLILASVTHSNRLDCNSELHQLLKNAPITSISPSLFCKIKPSHPMAQFIFEQAKTARDIFTELMQKIRETELQRVHIKLSVPGVDNSQYLSPWYVKPPMATKKLRQFEMSLY